MIIYTLDGEDFKMINKLIECPYFKEIKCRMTESCDQCIKENFEYIVSTRETPFPKKIINISTPQ